MSKKNAIGSDRYVLHLRSILKDHMVIAKVATFKGMNLKIESSAVDALAIWRKLVRNLPIETIEALEKLIKKRLDTFYAAKSVLQVKKLEKNKSVSHRKR